MSLSRPLVGLVAATLLTPALATAGTTAASGVTTASPTGVVAAPMVTAARVKQRAKLLMHPQIAQPGSNPGAPTRAKSAMTAQFKPAKKGRTVKLQRKQGKRWVTIKKAKQNGQGRVDFVAPYKRKRKIQTYRVLAVRYDGLSAKASRGAATNKWGGPDLSDVFSGSSLPANWKHRQTDYTGKRQCAKTSADNLHVANGTLRLSVTKDQNPPQENELDLDPKCEVDGEEFDYRLTGQAATSDSAAFLYGYASARIKFQPRAGQHAAFWLQPKDATNDTGAEIDVIEWFGDRKKDNTELTQFIHKDGVKDTTCGFIKDHYRFGKEWAGSYHVFSVEWTKKAYIFRIDGRETCRTTKFVSQTPEYLILSLQANTYELPLLDGDPAAPHETDGFLPQHMHVDWVRFWER